MGEAFFGMQEEAFAGVVLDGECEQAAGTQRARDRGHACSVDTGGNVVEVSDAQYPADRTELRFSTPLKPWSE